MGVGLSLNSTRERPAGIGGVEVSYLSDTA